MTKPNSAHDDASLPPMTEDPRGTFVAFQGLSKSWYDKEREGIALLERLQTALLACRPTPTPPPPTTVAPRGPDGPMGEFLAAGGRDHKTMDPWLAEDLFAQVQGLRGAFQELLAGMYRHVPASEQAPVPGDEPQRGLPPREYRRFLQEEVASFEAEYQHIEALLAMLSFDITSDALRTLLISWSTSPFLVPERARAFRARHQAAVDSSAET